MGAFEMIKIMYNVMGVLFYLLDLFEYGRFCAVSVWRWNFNCNRI